MAAERTPAVLDEGGQGSSEGGVETSDLDVTPISREDFRKRPLRPQGSKVAKAQLLEQGKRESILKSQARATEQMAAANMRKAEAMMDHAAMSLFRMPIDDLDEEAREYFQLRRKEELERIKRRIESERRSADREKLEHDRLLQECSLEVRCDKRHRTFNSAPNFVTVEGDMEAGGTPSPPPAPSARVSSPLVSGGDAQDDPWNNSQCIPDTQPHCNAPPMQPGFVDNRHVVFGQLPRMHAVPNSFTMDSNQNGITEGQVYGYRNLGQGLNLNARFYSQ